MSTKYDEFGLTPPVSIFFAAPSSGCCQIETRSVSLPPTMSERPSGIHSARTMPRSIACVSWRT
jgi:hypothetical protein